MSQLKSFNVSNEIMRAQKRGRQGKIRGLNPGPLLFVEHKDFVWGLIASMYLGNFLGLVLVLTTVPIFASMLGAARKQDYLGRFADRCWQRLRTFRRR